MPYQSILASKALKAKQKTAELSSWLSQKPEQLHEFIAFAKTAKDPIKATCIETIEYVSKTNPQIVDKKCLDFVTSCLTEKAPRVKWESARVIGNAAHIHPKHLNEAIKNLLVNTEDAGTVVRWSTAYALSEIIKIKPEVHKGLKQALESVCEREEQNSIKKIYLAAFKKC